LLAVVVNVPAVTKKFVVLVKALPNDHPPPTPFNVTCKLANVTLLVVIVLPVVVAKKLTTEPAVVVNTTPVAALVQFPYTLITEVALDVIVTLPDAGPAMVTSKQTAFVPIVTAYAVALDAESKITLSAEVGAVPDKVVRPTLLYQLVVVVASHVPAPPPQ
jgi:hypothetical protein